MKNRVLARLLQGRPSSASRRLFYGAAQRGGVTVISQPGDPWNPDIEQAASVDAQTEEQPETGDLPLPKEQGKPS